MSDYILGYGIFSIGGIDIALTRGGGQFTVERVYKEVVADGDYGPVKGRVRKDGSRAKLVIRSLSIISTNLEKMYPAISVDSTTVPGTATVTGKADIEEVDFNAVKFTGVTKEGKSIIIDLTDAINLENLDWPLLDKDEVVAELTYTAAYDPATRNVEPWKIDFVDAA
jgi:hypothetical protein